MVQETFQKLNDFILKYNPYLQKGFPNVVKDTTTGLIIQNDFKNEHTVIFPNDRLGTYFYLRNEAVMNFSIVPELSISDCLTGANQFQVPVRLVSVTDKKTDPYSLIWNLVNTLAHYVDQISITSAEWNTEKILALEMTGAKQKDIDAALQRVGHNTIMAISFVMVLPIEFLAMNCLSNPCLPC